MDEDSKELVLKEESLNINIEEIEIKEEIGSHEECFSKEDSLKNENFIDEWQGKSDSGEAEIQIPMPNTSVTDLEMKGRRMKNGDCQEPSTSAGMKSPRDSSNQESSTFTGIKRASVPSNQELSSFSRIKRPRGSITVVGHDATPYTLNFNYSKIYRRHTAIEHGCGFIACILAHMFTFLNFNSKCFRLGAVIENAKDLARNCNLNFDCEMGAQEFAKVEEQMKVRIVIFGLNACNNNKLFYVYKSQVVDRTRPLLILGLNETTYLPIRNIRHLYVNYDNSRKYGRNHDLCRGCLEFTDNIIDHCKECCMVCVQCKNALCNSRVVEGEKMTCDDCKREFFNHKCFGYHKQNKVCRKYKICKCGSLQIVNERGEFKHKICTVNK